MRRRRPANRQYGPSCCVSLEGTRYRRPTGPPRTPTHGPCYGSGARKVSTARPDFIIRTYGDSISEPDCERRPRPRIVSKRISIIQDAGLLETATVAAVG